MYAHGTSGPGMEKPRIVEYDEPTMAYMYMTKGELCQVRKSQDD